MAELADAYRTRVLSPAEVVQATLERIELLNPLLNAYISVFADQALADARAAENRLRSDKVASPLCGIPVSVKDLIKVRGGRTTAGSRVLVDAAIDRFDAVVVRRIRDAGAVVIGKTNLTEFAHGGEVPEEPFGVVQNPRRLGYQPGASSAGAAVAVAAGLSVVSLGTDTGGSIRHPASLCGVVGLKPTHGLVPLHGTIPVSPRLDAVGPLGRSAVDVAAALTVMACAEPSATLPAPCHDFGAWLRCSPRDLRLGIVTEEYFRFGHPAVITLLDRVLSVLCGLGLTAVAISPPRSDEANALVERIALKDLSVYHARYRGQESRYGDDLKQRIDRGRELDRRDYSEAIKAQARFRRRWLELFREVDVVLMPANVTPAPRLGDEYVEVQGVRYSTRIVNSRYNRIANVTGFPAVVFPIGDVSGLPISAQLLGPPFAEARLLSVANAVQNELRLPQSWGIEPRGPDTSPVDA